MIIDTAPSQTVTMAPLVTRPLYKVRIKEHRAVFEIGARSDGWHTYFVFGPGWQEAGSHKTQVECEAAVAAALSMRAQTRGNGAAGEGVARS